MVHHQYYYIDYFTLSLLLKDIFYLYLATIQFKRKKSIAIISLAIDPKIKGDVLIF